MSVFESADVVPLSSRRPVGLRRDFSAVDGLSRRVPDRSRVSDESLPFPRHEPPMNGPSHLTGFVRVRVLFRPRSVFSGRRRSPSGASRYPRPWATPRGEARWALCSRRRRWRVGARFLTTTVGPATALGGGEGPTGLPSRSRAQHLVPTLGGRLALGETIHS
jgi:hypothetical protein